MNIPCESAPVNKTPEKPIFIRPKDVAMILDISVATVHRNIKKGCIPAFVVGKQFFIPLDFWRAGAYKTAYQTKNVA